jgi:hypothetical protein
VRDFNILLDDIKKYLIDKGVVATVKGDSHQRIVYVSADCDLDTIVDLRLRYVDECAMRIAWNI